MAHPNLFSWRRPQTESIGREGAYKSLVLLSRRLKMHRCAVHPLPCTPKLPHAPGTAVAMAVAASPPCSRCRICISIPSSCTFSRQKVPGAANQPPQLHWLHLQPAANIAQMTPVTWTSSGITSIVPLGFFFSHLQPTNFSIVGVCKLLICCDVPSLVRGLPKCHVLCAWRIIWGCSNAAGPCGHSDGNTMV